MLGCHCDLPVGQYVNIAARDVDMAAEVAASRKKAKYADYRRAMSLNRLWLRTLNNKSSLSHTRTIVRECYKDDCESLWKSLKFDPSPRKNGSTDRPPNLHR